MRQSRAKSPQWREEPAATWSESPGVEPEERAVMEAAESPTVQPQECGINGCRTWYDDPIVMARHRERVHGIGGQSNQNQPEPRNPNPKWV